MCLLEPHFWVHIALIHTQNQLPFSSLIKQTWFSWLVSPHLSKTELKNTYNWLSFYSKTLFLWSYLHFTLVFSTLSYFLWTFQHANSKHTSKMSLVSFHSLSYCNPSSRVKTEHLSLVFFNFIQLSLKKHYKKLIILSYTKSSKVGATPHITFQITNRRYMKQASRTLWLPSKYSSSMIYETN